MVSQMAGTAHAIERAMIIREESIREGTGGGANETLWSTVDQAHTTIAATQDYALRQIKVIEEKLENQGRWPRQDGRASRVRGSEMACCPGSLLPTTGRD